MKRGLASLLIAAGCVLPVDIQVGPSDPDRNAVPVLGSVSPELLRVACCERSELDACDEEYRVNAVSDDDVDQDLELRWFVRPVDHPAPEIFAPVRTTFFAADPATGERNAPSDAIRISDLVAEAVLDPLTLGDWVVEVVLSDGFAADATSVEDPRDMRLPRSGRAADREVWLLTIVEAGGCP